jgi:hypothetical protein
MSGHVRKAATAFPPDSKTPLLLSDFLDDKHNADGVSVCWGDRCPRAVPAGRWSEPSIRPLKLFREWETVYASL